MKRWKQIIAVSCAAVLALSAAGCGKKNDSTEAAPAEKETLTTRSMAEQGETAEESSEEASEEAAAEAEAAEEAAEAEEEEALAESIPAVITVRHFDDDVNLEYDGLLVISDGFEALDQALHAHNAQIQENALTCRENLDSSEYEYSNKAEVRRCDRTVLSCTQESYCYIGQSDSRPSLKGYNFDVNSGKELAVSDVITDEAAFSKAVAEKLNAHPDHEFFADGWEETAEETLKDADEFSWFLTDDALKVIFAKGLVSYTEDVVVKIPYDECSSFLKERYMNASPLLCHLVDDYGMTCPEYSFDADGDGKDELLTVDADYVTGEGNYVEAVRPVISFGRDRDSLITADTSEYEDIYEMGNAWVMQSSEGSYYVYVEATVSDDSHILLIYDLNDPDAGPVSKGYNQTGAFCGFVPSDPEQLYVVNRVYCMGSWNGYTECRVGRDGQLTGTGEGDPEYFIMSFNDSEAFDSKAHYSGTTYPLTLKQQLECYVYGDNGDGSDETLESGTELYPYLCGGEGSYMIFRLKDGRFVQLMYDDMADDEWEQKIQGIPVDELLEGMIYAG